MLDICKELKTFPKCGKPYGIGVDVCCQGTMVPIRDTQKEFGIRGVADVRELSWKCTSCGNKVES